MDLDSYSKTTKNMCKQKTEMYQLLLDIFKRIDENSIQDLSKFIPIEEMNQENSEQDNVLISQYIKQIVFYLSKQKLEYQSQLLNRSEDDQQSYEYLIQKLENDVRQHIRIEQQQRLHIENLESKLDEAIQIYEQDTSQLKQEIENLKKQLKEKNNHKPAKSYTQNNYLPSTQSSQPSTSQRKKSTSEKKLEVIQQYTDRQQTQSKVKRKIQQNSGSALPKQIQDLFNKMQNDIDNSTIKESKSVNKIRNSRSQKINKDIKAIEKSDIIKNLQQQFEDSDKLKEIEKQLNETYLTQREMTENANDVSNYATYGSQKYYFHQIKKAINNQDLNKSNSYEVINKQKSQSKEKSNASQKTLSLLRLHQKKKTPC